MFIIQCTTNWDKGWVGCWDVTPQGSRGRSPRQAQDPWCRQRSKAEHAEGMGSWLAYKLCDTWVWEFDGLCPKSLMSAVCQKVCELSYYVSRSGKKKPEFDNIKNDGSRVLVTMHVSTNSQSVRSPC